MKIKRKNRIEKYFKQTHNKLETTKNLNNNNDIKIVSILWW